MTEGSVVVDGFDSDSQMEDSSNETESTVETPEGEDKPEAPENKSVDGEGKKPELTEKGTKLDPNPASAVHQELANERRVRAVLESTLQDPEKLAKFIETAGIKLPNGVASVSTVEPPKLEFSPDTLNTPEEAADALNKINSTFSEKFEEQAKVISELTSQLQGLSSESRQTVVTNNLKGDISTVREEYPELNPKSSTFNPELEKKIGQQYKKLDYDEQTGSFRGNFSLAEIARDFMEVVSLAKGQGIKEAQTTIKEKQSGKVVTSGKQSASSDQAPTSAGAAVAQIVKSAFRK
jgi:hypothetical protein